MNDLILVGLAMIVAVATLVYAVMAVMIRRGPAPRAPTLLQGFTELSVSGRIFVLLPGATDDTVVVELQPGGEDSEFMRTAFSGDRRVQKVVLGTDGGHLFVAGAELCGYGPLVARIRVSPGLVAL